MSKRKKPKKRSGINKQTLSKGIIGIFSNSPNKAYNYKEISKRLFVTNSNEKKFVGEIMNELAEQDLLEEVYTGKYKLKSKGGYIIGKVDIATSGYGFVISDALEEDIFISQKNLNHALDGDVVKVYLFARKKEKSPEGEVVEIIERKKEKFVGILEVSERFAFLSPDNYKINFDIFIPLDKLNGAKNGQKVIAKIKDWPKGVKNPFGEVIEILGKPGDINVEMHAILTEFGLPYKFSGEVEQEANRINIKITEEEYKARRDFRDVVTFTIDPEDAKDFDDALSIQKLKNGNWEVGIHIADVTHYVRQKSILDEEAYKRGTSVYLVDRVVPMLPEILSNNVCSLRPDEEKLCFSAVFEMDNDANVLNEWFGKTVILSNRRFTYQEAQNIIDTKEGDLSEEMLTLYQLSRKLRDNRFRNGAIAFERDEVKIDVDEKGTPVRIYFREHGESNELVEEFMLLANKQVAGFIGDVKNEKDQKTFVYRIHDKPNSDRLESFANFIVKFGYNINLASNKKISDTLNQLLKDVKGRDEQNLIETLAVRSMAKAVYSTTNIGHYGLAFKYYSHFTSPIRRYPDIMVHRMLFDYLNAGESKNKKDFEKMCKHSSEMEQLAVDAERASIKYKQVEFLQDKVGQVFEGIISGVAEFGIFVEIKENKCEGLVAIRDLLDDFYEYDEDNYCLTGRSTKKKYQLGDQVKVEILRTNISRKQIDFVPVE